MKFFEWLFTLFISSLLALKTYELLRSLWWAQQHGLAYSEELHFAIKKWRERLSVAGMTESKLEEEMRPERQRITNKYKRTWTMGEWPIGRHFMCLRFPLKQIMVNILFRLPTLIFFQTLIIFSSNNRELLVVSICLVWSALWADVLHNLVNILNLGYMNGYFRRTISTNRLSHDYSPYPHASELTPSRRQLVRGFATLFSWLLALNIIGYAGIYAGLDTLSMGAFHGLNESWSRPLDLLYFSIVTLATVGYGDIFPHPDAILVRLAVASQIISGVSLTVFLLTSFSLTIDPE